MTKRLTTLLAAVAVLGSAAGAHAAQRCVPRGDALAALAERYGETRRGIGLDARGSVLEVFAAEAGGWTILVTRPDGVSCMVASGTGYEDLAESLPPQA